MLVTREVAKNCQRVYARELGQIKGVLDVLTTTKVINMLDRRT